jgi:hypothetical protein
MRKESGDRKYVINLIGYSLIILKDFLIWEQDAGGSNPSAPIRLRSMNYDVTGQPSPEVAWQALLT